MDFFKNRSGLAFQFGIAIMQRRASGIDGNQAGTRQILQRFEFGRGFNITETLELRAVLILPPPDPVRV